jgi:uncharacterized protein YbdZ (MbtH family)
MNSGYHDDETIYSVVVNHEEQYSIWPSHRDIPLGWRLVGKTGRKDECLEYIDSAWMDMRPLSLRKHMEEMEDKREAGQELLANDRSVSEGWNRNPSLVERLSSGRHRVEAALRPGRTLKDCLERNCVHIRFTQTRGGTQVGLQLDKSTRLVALADVDNGRRAVHLEGELILDHAKVRCVVDLDVASLCGEGYFIPVNDDFI